jgi:hypothetical protein
VVEQAVALQEAVCEVVVLVQHLDGSDLHLEVAPMRLLLENTLTHTFW